ncbi:hypothetical protein [Georgenia alba]|uniref:DUF4231 domain-containing protein n=1 Tax=Georgenia alba TaxID=2233858 RepID=A0ABW2QAF3_9MICO
MGPKGRSKEIEEYDRQVKEWQDCTAGELRYLHAHVRADSEFYNSVQITAGAVIAVIIGVFGVRLENAGWNLLGTAPVAVLLLISYRLPSWRAKAVRDLATLEHLIPLAQARDDDRARRSKRGPDEVLRTSVERLLAHERTSAGR